MWSWSQTRGLLSRVMGSSLGALMAHDEKELMHVKSLEVQNLHFHEVENGTGFSGTSQLRSDTLTTRLPWPSHDSKEITVTGQRPPENQERTLIFPY
ncbi:hypothetical protein TNCV_3701671 [Trichonephila clavipes]|nr:hypothetical protein TNCV_3701671 [Trichonephila clavipes]